MENNIVYDSYYLVNKFTKDHKDVTNLQVQKLMYFFECYYMNLNDGQKLYDCNFCAWAFGPVAIPLYKEYKKFGNNKIELDEKQRKIGEEISDDKKEVMNQIYKVFGNLSPMALVAYTHREDSPWTKVWERNGEKIKYGSDSYIDKTKSMIWFRNVFTKES